MDYNPRRSNGWARDKLSKRKKALGYPCHLCGYPIDTSIKYPSKRCFVLDEIVPISKGGKSTWDNTAGAHRCCNSWRSDKDLTPSLRAKIRERYEREILGRKTVGKHSAKIIAQGKASKVSRTWDEEVGGLF